MMRRSTKVALIAGVLRGIAVSVVYAGDPSAERGQEASQRPLDARRLEQVRQERAVQGAGEMRVVVDVVGIEVF
jgi:hypothetical protein